MFLRVGRNSFTLRALVLTPFLTQVSRRFTHERRARIAGYEIWNSKDGKESFHGFDGPLWRSSRAMGDIDAHLLRESKRLNREMASDALP